MVTLVMYSDQVIPQNRKVDLRLLDLLAGRKRIGYMPSGPEPDRRYYSERRAYCAALDLDLSVFFDIAAVDADGLADLLDSDAIHLAGGDTRAFLQLLKAHGLMATLSDWAQKGGLMIGTSAGAILMTTTVAIDAIFTGEDPKAVHDGGALNLVPFEFFPHYDSGRDYLPELLSYSAKTPNLIAACRDGDGIVVRGGVVECVGDIVWIRNGTVIPS